MKCTSICAPRTVRVDNLMPMVLQKAFTDGPTCHVWELEQMTFGGPVGATGVLNFRSALRFWGQIELRLNLAPSKTELRFYEG